MKNEPRKELNFGAATRRSLLILCLLAALCGLGLAQDWKTLKPGIEYAAVTRDISGLNVNINLLRLDLAKVRLDVVHAFDRAIGTDKTSSIASGHNGYAAINAGFFRLDTTPFAGDAAGILQINGTLLSEPINDRIQLLINNGKKRTDVFIARPTFSEAVRFDNEVLDLTGINRELKKDDLVLYTPEFGPSTMSKPDALEAVVVAGKVSFVGHDMGNSSIPKGGFVVAASGTFKDRLTSALGDKTPRVTLIRKVTGLPTGIGDPMKGPNEWDIVAGVPLLIQKGRIDITWQQEKSSKSFVETRHPRTAVAKLRDGKFLMLTVDGRSESSGGIGLQDLAEYLLSLGAVDAMNLDGGGSTTMWVDGKIVNHPSDKEGERKVSDILLVTPRTSKKRN